jgi:putative transposase
VKFYGKYVEGLSSGRDGLSWNFATAVTRVNGKTLVLAAVRYVRGVSKVEIVRSLVGQVLSLGVRVKLLAMDAGFYTVEVLRYISQFNYVLAVPVGDVRVYGEYDGEYKTESERHKAEDQAGFRLLVHGRKVKKGEGRRSTWPGPPTRISQRERSWSSTTRSGTSWSPQIKVFLTFTSSTKRSGS